MAKRVYNEDSKSSKGKYSKIKSKTMDTINTLNGRSCSCFNKNMPTTSDGNEYPLGRIP